MSRHDIVETLEICLRRIAAGSTIDAVVADYPDQAGQLRELLEIAQAAQPDQPLRVPAKAQANSRKRLLARAEQLKSRPRPLDLWGGLRFLRQHVASAALVVGMVALLFIALGSANTLPGDGLYPVKLAAERAGISLAASDATRLEREAGFDTRRAEEVAMMIRQNRTGAVAFGGFLTSLDPSGWQAAGIPLQFSSDQEQQAQGLAGAFVELRGTLGSDGAVTVETFDPLLFSLRGTIRQMSADSWIVDDRTVRITPVTRVSGSPQVGSEVAVQAARMAAGNQVLAVSVEVAEAAASPTPSPSLTARPTETTPAATTAVPTQTSTKPATQVTSPTPKPAESETSSPEGGNDDHETPEPGDDHGGDNNEDHGGDDSEDHSGEGSGGSGEEDDSGSGSSENSRSGSENSGSGSD